MNSVVGNSFKDLSDFCTVNAPICTAAVDCLWANDAFLGEQEEGGDKEEVTRVDIIYIEKEY